MGETHGKGRSRTRYVGNYSLPDNPTGVGELSLETGRTLLTVHSDEFIQPFGEASFVNGQAFTDEYLTLVNCQWTTEQRSGSDDSTPKYTARVFPHYVIIGRRHTDPNQPEVVAIHFSTTDLDSLFYDFDAFGLVSDSSAIIDDVLEERRQIRPVETGDYPLVFYFSGKREIVNVVTAVGRISAHHTPRWTTGGPHGFSLKNRIEVTIEPPQPILFERAVDLMHEAACFLSMAAGRLQGIDEISATTVASEGSQENLAVHPSFRWGSENEIEEHRPAPSDVPLDPIHRRTEFDSVLADWFCRQDGWRTARFAYISCLRNGNVYDSGRLVAAANMFDILPPGAAPESVSLPEDVQAAVDATKGMFRSLPAGSERDGVLSALGRLGRPSLPMKVMHRASVVESRFGATFSDLQFVGQTAIKYRNCFVHGPSVDFPFDKVEPFLKFFD